MTERILNTLFGTPEEINGANRCPTYLWRWFILKTRWFNVYLHHFVGDDWSRDLHDHPKRFISIGLKGMYTEWWSTQRDEFRVSEGGEQAGYVRTWKAPWFRSFPAEHIHRLTLVRDDDGNIASDCWTLVITLKSVRQWGFWHNGRFIGFRTYVDSEIADEMKACD